MTEPEAVAVDLESLTTEFFVGFHQLVGRSVGGRRDRGPGFMNFGIEVDQEGFEGRTSGLGRGMQLREAQSEALARRMVSMAEVLRPATRVAADVGCGRGGALELLSAFDHVLGVDRSAAGLGPAKRRGHVALQAESAALPLRQKSIDLLLNIESASMYADRPRFFAEVARVLAPQGVFAYADVLPASVVKPLIELWARCGLERVAAEDISDAVIGAATQRGGAVGSAERTVVEGLRSGVYRYVAWIGRRVEGPAHANPAAELPSGVVDGVSSAMDRWDRFVADVVTLAIAELSQAAAGQGQ